MPFHQSPDDYPTNTGGSTRPGFFTRVWRWFKGLFGF